METSVNGIIDITFQAPVPDGVNPWQHKWKTLFISPGGYALSIPGYYDGDSKWVTRFSPKEEGEWTYRSYSTISGLNGKTGSVSVKRADETGKSVIIDPEDPTKLIWDDGTHYYLMGFECDWLSLLDHDVEGIPKARKLIKAMKENGFNHVVMNVYARDTEWEFVKGRGTEYDYANPPLWPFGGSWDKPDYSVLNPDFFAHLDQVLLTLKVSSIVSHLMIYVWNKRVPWPELGSDEDNAYFDYVAARYQAFSNIVWDVSKEALLYGNCTREYIKDRCLRLRKLDAYNRLLTVHDRGFCEEYPTSVDIISTQTWDYDIHTNMKELAKNYPHQPVYNIEHGGYEKCPYHVFPGDYENAEVCLERNYACVFAGVYSTYYWQGCSWNIVIHDMDALPLENQPKLHYFKYMTDFFEKYPYADYRAADRAPTGSSYVLSHKRKNQILIYKPNGHYAFHSGAAKNAFFGGVIPKETTWFNTLTGEYKTIPFTKHFKEQQWMEFTSPWGEGPAICVIEW